MRPLGLGPSTASAASQPCCMGVLAQHHTRRPAKGQVCRGDRESEVPWAALWCLKCSTSRRRRLRELQPTGSWLQHPPHPSAAATSAQGQATSVLAQQHGSIAAAAYALLYNAPACCLAALPHTSTQVWTSCKCVGSSHLVVPAGHCQHKANHVRNQYSWQGMAPGQGLLHEGSAHQRVVAQPSTSRRALGHVPFVCGDDEVLHGRKLASKLPEQGDEGKVCQYDRVLRPSPWVTFDTTRPNRREVLVVLCSLVR